MNVVETAWPVANGFNYLFRFLYSHRFRSNHVLTIPDIPDMVSPSPASSVAFIAIIAFVSIAIVAGIWRGGPTGEPMDTKRRWGIRAVICMPAWLAIGAVVPLSGILETKMLPPPPMFLLGASFLLVVLIAFSSIGLRLARLPLSALIGFHAFRLPLELILHNWYKAGTLPVQMTYEGHNFDIATGILAIVMGTWAMFGQIPRAADWLFNVIGTSLLAVVITIALTSSPLPFRQYMNEPQVLLVYHFPFSWIVSIAVAGALLGHLVLFRKLLKRADCYIVHTACRILQHNN